MRIVYFYQYFSTPKGSWGTRVYEFCRDWVAQGHEVTVVTSIYYKSDLKATRFIEDQDFEGIRVKVLNIGIDNKESVFKRILSFVQYSVISCWYAVTMKADVVVASSGPITVGLPGLAARWLRGRKLVFETRDLWPDGAIEMGLIRNPLFKRLAYALESACYRSSSHIVCLSPGMVDNISKRFGLKNLTSVTNAADLRLFGDPRPDVELPDVFSQGKVAIYTGNIGQVNNSDLLLRAAVMLNERGRDDIQILLVGDGQLRDHFMDRKRELGLENFHIHGMMPKDRLVAYVQNSMVSLVPLKGTPVLDTSSPNKLYESLAAGVPVIQNTKGWIREMLEESGCGYTVDADDERELVDILIRMADDPDMTAEMGRKGKELAQREFDKTLLADKMLKVLEGVAGAR
jgi:glycosyltransferase involved in cell wall biosynthesis